VRRFAPDSHGTPRGAAMNTNDTSSVDLGQSDFGRDQSRELSQCRGLFLSSVTRAIGEIAGGSSIPPASHGIKTGTPIRTCTNRFPCRERAGREIDGAVLPTLALLGAVVADCLAVGFRLTSCKPELPPVRRSRSPETLPAFRTVSQSTAGDWSAVQVARVLARGPASAGPFDLSAAA
jgi:hypothetical protein